MESRVRDEQELRRLEVLLMSPEGRKSSEAVTSLLAADFIEFGQSGFVYDRQCVIAALQEELPIERTMTDFAVRWLADSVALVTYRSARRDPAGGKDIHSLRSSVWSQIDGRWQMAFHQGTPMHAT